MPRTTHRHPKPDQRSTYDELRNLRLAVSIRAEQVKLRRLEWDTQRIALPHLTPLPGDGVLQIRKPMTTQDVPVPPTPPTPPDFELRQSPEVYKSLMALYVNQVQSNWSKDPYNQLASISAQEKRTDQMFR